MTNCECSGPGYCTRHSVHRNESTFRMCSESQMYFDVWERKRKKSCDLPDEPDVSQVAIPTLPVGRSKKRNAVDTAELWREAHEYAPAHADNWEPMAAMRWYNAWVSRIPRFGCGCQNHWNEMTQRNRPTFTSPKAFFEWFWARHDDVSRQHSGRPRITLDQAYAMYWPDAVR